MSERDPADPFFERLYAAAGDRWDQIPWARLAPRQALVHWLDEHPPAAGTPALVVACGLGDDAEELASRGCAVDAFDLSETAIAAARRRFPDTTVDYQVADLFGLPPEWRGRFDIVVEVLTVQSLPPEWHRRAITAITDCVAPGGRLLVRTAVRGDDDPDTGRPWPLTPTELRYFEDDGLREVRRCWSEDRVFVHIDYERPA